jgi:pimeloyl-ACP methyl ester carboxylesterase
VRLSERFTYQHNIEHCNQQANSTMISSSVFTSTSIYDKNYLTTVEEWLSGGRRVNFDPKQKAIVSNKTKDTVAVFERVSPSSGSSSSTRWLTLLPGFPDGSYGYAKVDRLLGSIKIPKLYVEYVGQGDSDKPEKYDYSTVERADLVESQWRAHGIKCTVVVTFDYSSIVLMELLQRQRTSSAFRTRIEHVLAINGGLFADGHSHPITTTPLLKTPFGAMGASMAQRSNLIFDTMLKPLYGKDYRKSKLTTQELREVEKAIRLHRGARFLSQAAGFVDEHKHNASRWNLQLIYEDFMQHHGITLHVVGSSEDPFEYKQVDLAKQRLGSYYPNVKIERIPGGHLSTSEQAEALAKMIEDLARKAATPPPKSSWTAI